MQFLLVTTGSMGDTLPFIALGKELLRRGHRVTLVANEHFKKKIESYGFSFAASIGEERYSTFLKNQSQWSDREGLRDMGLLMVEMLDKVYRTIEDLYVPGETVVAAQGYALGARVAQDKLGVPTATVHLQAMWMRSIYDPPGLPNWFPRWFPRAIDNLIDFFVDRRLGTPTNALRAELGLPPVKKILKSWWNSPQLVIGFFPEWYNPRQPDWPANVILPGFPTLDEEFSNEEIARQVDEYLAEGEPPLLVSQSSITFDKDYLALTAELVDRVGKRAIILTPYPEQIPPALASHVRCFSYVPLAKLMPRCAAHIHHGGIGTIAYTLAAGIPQLTIPMAYDQPDNAQRLLRLGVSDLIARKRFKPQKAAPRLEKLMTSPKVAERCRHFAAKSREGNAVAIAADALERLVGTDRK